jgi:hypothetical protein
MRRRIKNKILLWFRIGAIPAMMFSVLNAVGITTLVAPKNDVSADMVVNSSIASPSANVIKAAPTSEAVLKPASKENTDIGYLTTGTTVAVYMRTDAVVSVILPDGTARELPR